MYSPRPTTYATTWLSITRKSEILSSSSKQLDHFRDSIIVLSYRNNGIPSKGEIVAVLCDLKKEVKVFPRPQRYVLSQTKSCYLLRLNCNYT